MSGGANDMDGKVALISGGGSGIGAAHGRLFAAAGARVIVADIDEAAASKCAETIGTSAVAACLDVRDASSWESVIKEAERVFGAVTVLVNSAGVLSYGGVADLDVNEFRKTLEVNLYGILLGMQAVINGMRQSGGGSIINIASGVGLHGVAGQAAYATSKWAVRGLSRSAALDLAEHRIRVNVICPGIVRTGMTVDHPEILGLASPMGRNGEPEDIAAVGLLLASDQSSFTTGAEFVIDGGRNA
jgi:3alpha(or 20beta)-hydroxysteroid dehydrogenase